MNKTSAKTSAKKDEALKMAIETFEPEESTWWSHTKMAKAYQACKEALEQQEVTYEQPHGWMQQLVSETDGKKTIRYTFTKTRIGKNDIPIYFEEALEQPAQEPAYQVGEIVNPYGSNIKIKQPAQEPIHNCPNCNSLFTKEIYSTPEPSWQGLSDDEINKIYGEVQDNCIKDFPTELYAAWFEASKEKNTP